ncbi:hypothetical protein PT974_04684 [Cladobotryum mycophilum]|uniref:PiggyBac transposable element-derived protein domain-containing protein n=1 Tax=Cladobotryum mycophilum TaxID=491253 RepID=A0ABR0SVQ4_9HYPO
MDSQHIAVTNLFDDELLIRLDHCAREQPADNTCRPTFEPTSDHGTVFEPLVITERDPQIKDLPSSPLYLFQHFLPENLVDKWVRYTNEGPIPGPEGPASKRSRKLDWRPTSRSEVYIWLGIMIYIGLHRENRIRDHWVTSTSKSQHPNHPIIKFMSFDRFHQLLRRLRTFNPNDNTNNSFARIDEWSQHIQDASEVSRDNDRQD